MASARKEAGEAGGTEFTEALGAGLRVWNSTRQGHRGVPYLIFIRTLWWAREAWIAEDKTGDKERTYCSGPDQSRRGLSQLCIIVCHNNVPYHISILLLMDTN